MQKTRFLLSSCALWAGLFLAGGCASAPQLTTARAGAPVAQADGVSLSVPRIEVDGRPDGPVKDSVAVYVVIENQGAREIVIAREDFVLGAPGGTRHAAICPAYLASASWAASSVRGRIVRTSGFGETLYLPPSQLPVAAGRVSVDSLPDGTLGPGGRAAGYLYFPRASAPAGRPMQLAWSVRDEASQVALSELKVALESGHP